MGHPQFADSSLGGIDFAWLAIDRSDQVAWLVTFGSGVVPPWIEREDSRLREVDTYARLAVLPMLAECRIIGKVEGTNADWYAAARRGVFAYDWNAYAGPFRLLAAPEKALTLDQLPDDLRELASQTRFAHLSFTGRLEITVDDVLACVHEPPQAHIAKK